MLIINWMCSAAPKLAATCVNVDSNKYIQVLNHRWMVSNIPPLQVIGLLFSNSLFFFSLFVVLSCIDAIEAMMRFLLLTFV